MKKIKRKTKLSQRQRFFAEAAQALICLRDAWVVAGDEDRSATEAAIRKLLDARTMKATGTIPIQILLTGHNRQREMLRVLKPGRS